jgi:uncharacterized protein (TIGR00369 family)
VSTGSYPTGAHFLGDLGVDTEVTSDTSATARVTVTPHLTGADGGLQAGVVATLVDLVGGFLGVRVLQPDWMATADLTVQVVRPVTGPIVEARASVLRRGRTTLVIEAFVFNVSDPRSASGDDDGAPAAWATLTFAILPASGGTPTLQVPTDAPNRWSLSGSGFDGPIADALLISDELASEGRFSMPRHSYLLNSLGAVQGGAMALLAETAATGALSTAVGIDPSQVVVTDLRLAYLALGRIGPIVSRVTVLDGEDAPAGLSATVELIDVGADDRLTTVITVGATTAVPTVAGVSG